MKKKAKIRNRKLTKIIQQTLKESHHDRLEFYQGSGDGSISANKSM